MKKKVAKYVKTHDCRMNKFNDFDAYQRYAIRNLTGRLNRSNLQLLDTIKVIFNSVYLCHVRINHHFRAHFVGIHFLFQTREDPLFLLYD